MSTPTKQCVACRQPILADARKCHHCHQVQTFPAALQHHPAVGAALGIVLLAIIAFPVYLVYDALHKENNVPRLTVGKSVLRIEPDSGTFKVSCFATISNADSVTWSDPSLQAEFFDSNGARVDVHYERHRLSIYPTLAAEGRVTGRANSDQSQYASCLLKVLAAT